MGLSIKIVFLEHSNKILQTPIVYNLEWRKKKTVAYLLSIFACMQEDLSVVSQAF